MERSIEILTVISLFILGFSHILQPRVWAEFFIELRDRGRAGVFWTAFVHFAPGVLIVSFHPVWSGIPLIVTLLGWGWTIKGTLYFCFPRIGLWSLARVSLERAWEFMIPGVGFVILGGVVGYGIWFN